MKMTAAHMEACKTGSSEIHNNREKELDYVRDDLSHLNESEVLQSISERLAHIKKIYQEATGQKMQKTAEPIQEVVLVVDEDTSLEQVKEFGRLCQEEFGMTPFQYYIHRDEGHWENPEAKTGWKPNYHAHIVFDTTCYEHKQVMRTKKSNGKNLKDENGKPLKIAVDAYGKTIKFTKQDLSRMQDLASIATGLERGIPSTKQHLSALQYKCIQALEELKECMAMNEKAKQDLSDIQGEARKEKFKATAADAGVAVLGAISGVFGGGTIKSQEKEIKSLRSENKRLQEKILKVQEDSKKELNQTNERIREKIEIINNQDKIIKQLQDIFPHAENCMANYQLLSAVGLTKEHIKKLMSGGHILYSGQLTEPQYRRNKFSVSNVDITLGKSQTGKMLPRFNGVNVPKFFSDLSQENRKSLGWSGGMKR